MIRDAPRRSIIRLQFVRARNLDWSISYPFFAGSIKPPIYEQILPDKTAVHKTLPAKFLNLHGFRTFVGSLSVIEADSQIAVCDFGVSRRRSLAESVRAGGRLIEAFWNRAKLTRWVQFPGFAELNRCEMLAKIFQAQATRAAC